MHERLGNARAVSTKKRTLGRIAAFLVAISLAAPAAALMPDEILNDPDLEARARALSKDLRCVVCQNEAIDSSNAEIARQMRLVVRERLVAGDSDREVVDYVVSRYGDFVLLNPPFKPATYALWFAPPAIAGPPKPKDVESVTWRSKKTKGSISTETMPSPIRTSPW